MPQHRAKAPESETGEEPGFASQLPLRPGSTTRAHFIVSLGVSFHLCRLRIINSTTSGHHGWGA